MKKMISLGVLALTLTGCGVSAEDRLVTYVADSVCYMQGLVNDVSTASETMSDDTMATLSQKSAATKDELEKKRKTYFATEEEVTRTYNAVTEKDQFFDKVREATKGECNADDQVIQTLITKLQ